tara:strand:- start:177 stop:401 length:225 start_codon:yes stop_codon:yes gene_type:complete
MRLEQPAWIVYDDDERLDTKYSYPGGLQAFKNAISDFKRDGRDIKRLSLWKGQLINKGGTTWELIHHSKTKILP